MRRVVPAGELGSVLAELDVVLNEEELDRLSLLG